MKNSWVFVWLIAAFAAALSVAAPAVLWAQQSPRSQFPDPRLYNDELTPGQIQRAQEPESAPRRATPSQPEPKQAATAARAITCSGVFAKDLSHLRISTAYRTENVTFTEVGAPDGKTLMASVLFPKDPKRRLEIWWQNEASRTGIHLMVINGQSTWTAPKGLRLGLPLAALERLNGKPFTLSGFDGDNLALVVDWQGGTLATLAGGCKAGVALRLDAKVPPEIRSVVSGASELTSSDAGVKAVKPTIAEILLGY